MKNLTFILMILSILSAQKIFESFGLDSKHSFSTTSTYEFPLVNNGERALVIEGIVGDIEVVGEETDLVNIIEVIHIHHASKGRAERILEKDKSIVSRDPNNNLIAISGSTASNLNIHYDYTIKLPIQYNLDVEITGGDIDINQLVGQVEVRTSGGEIDLSSITGKINAKTSGGDIVVNDSEGNINVNTSGGDIDITYTDGQIKGKTSGGDVTVHFIQGNVNVRTSGGGIALSNINGEDIYGSTSGGDIDVEDIKGDIEVKTSGGDIDVEEVDGNFTGTTSGGEIDLYSVNGHVNISTKAGDIECEKIKGSIYAHASHGDIEVEKTWNRSLNDHAIDLKTTFGSIELTLPENFPANIDARISDSWSDSEIESELPISVKTINDEKTGYLKIADGIFEIKLETDNGDIIIEED